jgi:predicted nucleic acid-binding protein
MIRVAVDTNILVYNAKVERHPDDARKIETCGKLLRQLNEQAALVIPVQVLGELYSVLTRNGRTREFAGQAVLTLAESFVTADSTHAAFRSALELATTHKLQFWDALILNAAAEAGCSILLSEDMGEGFTWRGTVVINPLAAALDPRLTKLLA